jgi:hypothetical protein
MIFHTFGRSDGQTKPIEAPSLPIPPASLWAAEHLGFTPDARQAEVLDLPGQRLSLCAGRQLGKTLVAAAKAIHLGYFHPGSLVLVFGPVGPQAGELLGRIRQFAHRLGLATRADRNHSRSVVLPNGSRFLALPDVPHSARGYANVALIIVDEAAFVDDRIFHAISPMLAVSNGALWVLSTPNGQTGRFYEICSQSDPAWTRVFAPSAESPRISAAFLAQERAFLGDALFRQEYECAFIANRLQFLDRELIAAASVPPVLVGTPVPSQTELFLGVDIGKRIDHSAIVALALSWSQGEPNRVDLSRPMYPRITLEYAESLPLGSAHLDLPAKLKQVIVDATFGHAPFTPKPTLVIDATGEGTLIELLRRSNVVAPGYFHPVTITGGHTTTALKDSYTGIPRPDLLTRLRSAFERRLIHLPPTARGFANLEHELVHFRADGHQREHDDLLFALALATWFLVEKRKHVLIPKR